MNQEFLTKCFRDSYVINENIDYLESALNNFANILNESLSVNSFSFSIEPKVIDSMFRGNISLKDGGLDVWVIEGDFYLEKKSADRYLEYNIFYISEFKSLESKHLHNVLGRYISANYPDFAAKINILQ